MNFIFTALPTKTSAIYILYARSGHIATEMQIEDLANVNNYGVIAIATALSKVLELALLS